MGEETKIDPRHESTRSILRTLGPTVLGIGLLFMAIGMGSFFYGFANREPPYFFWCAFVGGPLVFVGLVMCQFAFMGSVARYVSGEAAPVQKDTFNYLAEGTKEGVRTVATTIGEGLSAGKAVVLCRQCNRHNDADAKFCKNCGAAMGG